MSLSDLASLGSFASGLAVTVTLIFLVIQTRQANRNQRALMQQGRAASQVDLLLRYSESYFGRVSLRARASDLTLSDDEISTSIFLCLANWRSFEDGFLQYRAGTLDLESFQSDTTILRHLLSYPSQRATRRSPGRDSRAASATMSTQSCARRNPRTRLRSRMRGENSLRRNWQRSGREGLQIRRRLIQFAVCRRPLPGMIDWCAEPQLS